MSPECHLPLVPKFECNLLEFVVAMGIDMIVSKHAAQVRGVSEA